MNACPAATGYGTMERVATDLTPSFVAHRPQVSVPTEIRPITRARAIQYHPLSMSGKRKSVICEPKPSATRDEVPRGGPTRPYAWPSASSTARLSLPAPHPPFTEHRAFQLARLTPPPPSDPSLEPRGAPERLPSPTQHTPDAWTIPSSPLHRILPPRPQKTALTAPPPSPLPPLPDVVPSHDATSPVKSSHTESHRVTTSQLQSHRVTLSHYKPSLVTTNHYLVLSRPP